MQARAEGVFTTVKVADGHPHHLGRHILRLAESARIVGLDSPDPEDVRREVAAVLPGATAPGSPGSELARMRIDWDGSALTVTLEPLTPHPPTTTVIKAPDERAPDSPSAGAKSEGLGRQGRALLAWAREHGAGDTVLATTDGRLAEGATSNIFYVVGSELRTPTRATGLLAGIARDLVIETAGAREVDAPYEVLLEADEVFLTSSLRGVQAVTAVDGREIGGPGPVTRAAMAAWAALPTDD